MGETVIELNQSLDILESACCSKYRWCPSPVIDEAVNGRSPARSAFTIGAIRPKSGQVQGPKFDRAAAAVRRRAARGPVNSSVLPRRQRDDCDSPRPRGLRAMASPSPRLPAGHDDILHWSLSSLAQNQGQSVAPFLSNSRTSGSHEARRLDMKSRPFWSPHWAPCSRGRRRPQTLRGPGNP